MVCEELDRNSLGAICFVIPLGWEVRKRSWIKNQEQTLRFIDVCVQMYKPFLSGRLVAQSSF